MLETWVGIQTMVTTFNKQTNKCFIVNQDAHNEQGLGRPCAIGASKSIVAHWDPLSMRPVNSD